MRPFSYICFTTQGPCLSGPVCAAGCGPATHPSHHCAGKAVPPPQEVRSNRAGGARTMLCARCNPSPIPRPTGWGMGEGGRRVNPDDSDNGVYSIMEDYEGGLWRRPRLGRRLVRGGWLVINKRTLKPFRRIFEGVCASCQSHKLWLRLTLPLSSDHSDPCNCCCAQQLFI
jgi:hypothetical protein